MKRNLLLAMLVIALNSIAQTKPIQEFNFNGDKSNKQNDNSFLGVVKFVADRTGTEQSAIRIVNSSLEVTIPNLPISNKSRSVSIWVKYNDVSIANYIWGYGLNQNAQYFGLVQQKTTSSKSDLNLASWGTANDAIVSTSIAVNTWYNYTVTYDGLSSKIYRNGQLIRSSISAKKETTGDVFIIGRMGSTISINADIDDLKIYDVALSDEEVANLYSNSSILAPNVEVAQKTDIKPSLSNVNANTGKASKKELNKQELVLNAPKETTVVKNSEVFSTKGLKVISGSANQIDISSLPEGTYLLKVTNSSQNDNSKKLTIK
jgi:hypothetical protein